MSLHPARRLYMSQVAGSSSSRMGSSSTRDRAPGSTWTQESPHSLAAREPTIMILTLIDAG